MRWMYAEVDNVERYESVDGSAPRRKAVISVWVLEYTSVIVMPSGRELCRQSWASMRTVVRLGRMNWK